MLETEINKIKIVLIDLWKKERHTDSTKIAGKFAEEIDEIRRGCHYG